MNSYIPSALLLAKPEDREALLVYLFVSKNAKSIVLVNEQNGTQNHVYYVSKSFLNAETMYSRLEKLILLLSELQLSYVIIFKLIIFL